MRIQVALDNWGLIGGSERYAGEIVRALAAREHRIELLCGATAEPAMELPAGVALRIEPAYSDGAASARALEQMTQRSRAHNADVLLVLSCFQGRTFEALLELTPPVPIVRFVQDHTPFCPSLNKIEADGENCQRPLGVACLERYFIGSGCSCFHQSGRARPWIEGIGEFKKKLLEFDSLRRASALLVASAYMQRELVQAGESRDRIAVIPYFTGSNSAAIARAQLSSATREFLSTNDAPLIFTPARLALPDKGIDVLLAALAQTAAPWRAVIAGDGPARVWLEARCKAEGLADRVHFAGWQSAGQIETLYARAQVVAFPSTWKEPFGLVGIEAMAHGKPVVAFDVGGVSEWLEHDRTGLCVPRGDVAAFAAALSRLCGDSALAARLGQAGHQRAEAEFRANLHVSRIEAQLEIAAGVSATAFAH